MRTLRTVVAAGMLGVVGLCGCGPEEKATGTVIGKVSYSGEPVHSGTLNLISKTGAASMVKITDDGSFQFDAPVEVGEYTAYLLPPVPEPHAPGAKVAPPKKFNIPPKFQDPATSNVKVEVKAGENTLTVSFQ
jgi:hypothetical protein